MSGFTISIFSTLPSTAQSDALIPVSEERETRLPVLDFADRVVRRYVLDAIMRTPCFVCTFYFSQLIFEALLWPTHKTLGSLSALSEGADGAVFEKVSSSAKIARYLPNPDTSDNFLRLAIYG